MFALLFAVGFKGALAIAGLFLVGGGYLGYSYGSYIEKKAQAVAGQAEKVVNSVSSKL